MLKVVKSLVYRVYLTFSLIRLFGALECSAHARVFLLMLIALPRSTYLTYHKARTLEMDKYEKSLTSTAHFMPDSADVDFASLLGENGHISRFPR